MHKTLFSSNSNIFTGCMVTKSLKVSGAKQDAILKIYPTWNAFVDNGIHV